jgi:hypothetical protein
MYKCKNIGCSWTCYRKGGTPAYFRQIQGGHDRHCHVLNGITRNASKLRRIEIENSESKDVVESVDVVDDCLESVDDKYLLIQHHLEEILQNPSQHSSVGYIANSKKRKIKACFEDNLDLAKIFVNNQISKDAADDILKCVAGIVSRHKAEELITIPRTSRSVLKSVLSSGNLKSKTIQYKRSISAVLREMLRLEEHLPESRLCAIGSFIDPLELIAEDMVGLKPEDIYFCPPVEGEFNDFCSGKMYRSACELSAAQFHDNSVPLPIAINVDDTPFGGLRRRSACPMYVKNMALKSIKSLRKENYILAGIAPEVCCSDIEVKTYLKNSCNVINDTKAMKILSALKRYIRQDFITMVTCSIVKAWKTGIQLRCGGYSQVFRPYVALLILDNQQAYSCGNLHHNWQSMRMCRLCSTTTDSIWNNCSIAQLESNYRNSRDMENFSQNYNDLLRSYFMKKGSCCAKKDDITVAQQYNVLPSNNPLFNVFRVFCEAGVMSLYTAMPPDVLHTLKKGLCEQTLRLSLSVVRKLAGEEGIGKLNERAILFEVHQPCYAVGDRPMKLHQGFTHLCKGEGEEGGGFDGNRLMQALYLFTFCLGTKGTVVPNDSITRFYNQVDSYDFNPTEVILNSCVCALELLWLLTGVHCRSYAATDLAYIYKVLQSSNIHLIKLFEMKAVLFKRSKLFSKVKPHIMQHAVSFIAAMGSPEHWDTAPFENAHIVNIKKGSNSTRKQQYTIAKDLLQHSLQRRYLRILSQNTSPIIVKKSSTSNQRLRCNRRSILQFVDKGIKSFWTTAAGSTSSCFHPLVSIKKHLVYYIFQLCDSRQWRIIINECKKKGGAWTMSIVPSVSVSYKRGSASPEEDEMSKAEIYATRFYNPQHSRVKAQFRFDFVEIEVETTTGDVENKACKVFGILRFDKAGEEPRFLLLVCWLQNAKSSEEGYGPSQLPFQYVKYLVANSREKQLALQLVPAESVFCPMVGFHDVEFKESRTLPTCISNRYWVLPMYLFSRCSHYFKAYFEKEWPNYHLLEHSSILLADIEQQEYIDECKQRKVVLNLQVKCVEVSKGSKSKEEKQLNNSEDSEEEEEDDKELNNSEDTDDDNDDEERGD